MNDSSPEQGQCLCGAVRFEVPRVPHEIGMCHCGMCRKWAGGSPLVGGVADAVTVTAGRALRWYASSSWGERGFCGECGGSLFWRQKGAESGWLVCAAALPTPDDTRIVHHIFIDDKPAYYDMEDDAPRLTGAEFTAAVVGKMPFAKRALVKTFIALQKIKNRVSPPPAPAADGDKRGGCLCGGVRFTLPQASFDAGMCHCAQCRRWGGGGGVISVATAGASVESGDTLSWYASSAHSERGFCGRCGMPLFWRDANSGQITEVCVAALLDDRGIALSRQIYVDHKPAYCAMTGGANTDRLTGAEYERR